MLTCVVLAAACSSRDHARVPGSRHQLQAHRRGGQRRYAVRHAKHARLPHDSYGNSQNGARAITPSEKIPRLSPAGERVVGARCNVEDG